MIRKIIKIDEEKLRKNITVSAVKDTELIEITVLNENPIYSAQIANEIAKVFTEKVKEIYNIDNVQIVDEAEVVSEPANKQTYSPVFNVNKACERIM